MTTITINEKTTRGKKLLEYLRTLDYVKINENQATREFTQSVKELKSGNTKPISQLWK
jgi:hypothetical protein